MVRLAGVERGSDRVQKDKLVAATIAYQSRNSQTALKGPKSWKIEDITTSGERTAEPSHKRVKTKRSQQSRLLRLSHWQAIITIRPASKPRLLFTAGLCLSLGYWQHDSFRSLPVRPKRRIERSSIMRGDEDQSQRFKKRTTPTRPGGTI